jgi:hypothetical protein
MKKSISTTTKRRLEIQGFEGYPEKKLSQHKTGIRFAYLGCGTIVLMGFLFSNPVFYFLSMGIAFLAVVLPRHPLDYIYNYTIRHKLNLPAVPRRTPQSKFACGLATVWLAAILFFMLNGMTLVYQVATLLLLTQAFIVGTIDFCVPSMIYNYLFRDKKLISR